MTLIMTKWEKKVSENLHFFTRVWKCCIFPANKEFVRRNRTLFKQKYFTVCNFTSVENSSSIKHLKSNQLKPINTHKLTGKETEWDILYKQSLSPAEMWDVILMSKHTDASGKASGHFSVNKETGNSFQQINIRTRRRWRRTRTPAGIEP